MQTLRNNYLKVKLAYCPLFLKQKKYGLKKQLKPIAEKSSLVIWLLEEAASGYTLFVADAT